ncbi:MAG: ribosomal protein S18-alanine N-acetyltransferase [bacterium]|nr:ribosomal protein S18-alanine N-acetyltransferase [bacterium]
MIVAMTPEHLPEVMRIDAQCHPIPWPRKAYESELARAEDRLYLLYVLAHPRRIVGYAGVAFETEEAHITTVTVAPGWRGQGVGARLFLALALAARRRNTSLYLEVAADNPSAQSLYRRFGLAPVGIQRGYYANMADALIMRADNIHQPDFAHRLVKIAGELDCT